MHTSIMAAGVVVLSVCSMASADALLLYQDSGDKTPPPPEATEAESKWYFTGDVGANFVLDSEVKEFYGVKFKFKPGAGMNFGFGYNFTKMFALEMSSGFTWNKIDQLNGLGPVPTAIGTATLQSDGDGDLYQVPFMVNFVVTIPIDKFSIGLFGGVGVQWTRFSSSNDVLLNGASTTFQLKFDTNSASFRYNVGVRLAYDITHNVKIGVNGMFAGSTEVNIGTAGAVTVPGFGTLSGGDDQHLKSLFNFQVAFGVNVAF